MDQTNQEVFQEVLRNVVGQIAGSPDDLPRLRALLSQLRTLRLRLPTEPSGNAQRDSVQLELIEAAEVAVSELIAQFAGKPS